MRSQRFSLLLGLALLASLVGATSASAASISYGDFIVGAVTFGNVTESSGTDPVPLYGPPDPFVIGLDFDPASFLATASGGAVDVTDAQLNFSVSSDDGIDLVSLFESGDYSLAGLGTPATSVFAGASLRATVTQVNGVDVAPISLASSNASFSDALPGVVIVAPWSLGVSLDIAGQIAALLGPDKLATEVEIVIDNQLLALSELSTLAIIIKKDFRIEIENGHPPVPEPSALLLLVPAFLALQATGRRRA
jgi:hypothetical protein